MKFTVCFIDVEKAEVVPTPGNGDSSAENTTLIVSTVVSLFVVVLVVVGALYYCRYCLKIFEY